MKMIYQIRHHPDNIVKTILELFGHLKTNLENGHYVKNNIDIKWMDVYMEKQKLIDKNITFDKLNKEREDDISIQYQRLNETKENLRKQKEILQLLSKKIEMEKLELNEQKRKFKKQILDYVNINNLITKLDD
jgi:type I site-specific restriction-modification system R (restriction) subunit